MQKTLNKFMTCLWYDSNAEEAMKFYATVFENAKLGAITHYGDAGHEVHGRPKGSVMTVVVTIDDQELMGLNGGPIFTINPSISLFIMSKNEKEIENLYKKLSDGGSIMMELNEYPWSKKYAWVTDKFGLSWQLMFSDKGLQKLSPCLMFTNQQQGRCEEAIKFYTSIFKNSKVEYMEKYAEGEPAPGMVKHAAFKLDGQLFIAMDSPVDHAFGSFSPATSLMVNCKNQAEIDEMWEKLQADGGAPSQCGWLTDKFGVSWQVVPSIMYEMESDEDPVKRDKVMAAVMKMTKFDIAELEKAYNS